MIRKLFAAALMTAGLAVPSVATATEPCYRTVICYEKVQAWEWRQVPYDVCLTRYDDCGRAYTVHVTKYRSVSVPVVKVVAVKKLVPVY